LLQHKTCSWAIEKGRGVSVVGIGNYPILRRRVLDTNAKEIIVHGVVG